MLKVLKSEIFCGFTKFRIFGILSLNGENSRKSSRINLIFVVQQNSTIVFTFLNDNLMRMKILEFLIQ